MSGAALTDRRLRPGVAVTPLRAGLHLRGRRGTLTLEGSGALPALWRLLAEPLREGRVAELLDSMAAGPTLRASVHTLLGQLDAHGLLLAEPAPAPPGGPVADWTGASAGRPGAAAAALARARAEVVSAAPDGPLAGAAGRALVAGGLPVDHTADPELPAGRVLLRLHGAGPERCVAVGHLGGTGYATAPGSPAQVGADAAALEARLGRTDPPRGPAPSGAAPAAFLPLLAGAAAHRLLCAAAGQPDPSREGEGEGEDEDEGERPPDAPPSDPSAVPAPVLPAVLLADARPLWADYRTWPGPVRIDADRRVRLAPAGTLGEALRRMAALTDERCGALPEPLPADLRQLPVPLAGCAPPGADAGSAGAGLLGGAARLDLARLDLFCRAAELHLGEGLFTVGATPGHARGRALRAAARRRPAPAPAPGQPHAVAADRWADHPQLRHWWATLTGRLGVAARLEVVRLAPGAEAYRAAVRPCAPGGRSAPPPPPLGDAVEATPGDAAAFAALGAVVRICAAAEGRPGARVFVPDGALAPLAAAGVRTADWEDAGGTGRWLADLAGREEAHQEALRRITGTAADPEAPAAPPSRPELAALLAAFGFTVLPAPQEDR
ncbi:hypothetical protein ACIQWR_37430 [Streptomyces sp. NPDC098789]|uniref:hypothetical protein n=1 Tax=Streptomyces sp. NPDC098789 TaxID=3366098 RepID=UPI003802798B